MRHGTYGRKTPIPMRVARFDCRDCQTTISRLPDFAGMEKLFLVGDIHGDFPPFHAFARRAQGRGVAVVQAGDFGHGFLDRPTAAGVEGFFRENADTCGFIRGNHDHPGVCRAMPGWIPDGHHDPDWDIMFVGGAFSVDRKHRTEGLDWWPDEECSTAELNAIVDRYIAVKPRIMVTHDAPAAAIEALFTDVTLFRPLSRTAPSSSAWANSGPACCPGGGPGGQFACGAVRNMSETLRAEFTEAGMAGDGSWQSPNACGCLPENGAGAMEPGRTVRTVRTESIRRLQ